MLIIADLLLVIAVVLIIIVIIKLWNGGNGVNEGYRNYFGMGPPLDKEIRSFPFCGSEINMYDEDANYPFLANTTVPEFSNEKNSLLAQLESNKKNTADVTELAGYDMTGVNTVIPNDNVDQLLAAEIKAQEYKQKAQDTSFGLDKAEVENFDQAPTTMTWSNAGRMIYDHPDTDNFNRDYYSNPSRTIGLADQRQAVIHFNEAAAYYGNVQEQIPISDTASKWDNQGVPVSEAFEFFDVVPEVGTHYVEDPRVPTSTYTYSTNGNSFKKRSNFDDILDNMNRRRNQLTADQYNRGTTVTNEARQIMNTVFSKDLELMEGLPWWEKMEP